MSKLDVARLMEKAAIGDSTLPNSVLNRQQADKFVDLVIDYTSLVKQTRVKRINHPSGEVNKLDLASYVTQGAGATTTATTRVPSESVVNYDTVKYRSAFDLESDFTEDNIEGGNVRDTLMKMFTRRIAVDSEIAAIQGDSTLTTGDGQSDKNNLLGVNDGWLKIITDGIPAGQVLDAAGAASSFKMFYDAYRKLPARYRTMKMMYKWITPSSIFDKWSYDTAARATVGGDNARVGNTVYRPQGIEMLEAALMPEDLTYGTAVTDASKLILTPPQNLLYFIQRDITVEWMRQPRTDKWEVTIHFRADFQVENVGACVLVKNISESGTDYA